MRRGWFALTNFFLCSLSTNISPSLHHYLYFPFLVLFILFFPSSYCLSFVPFSFSSLCLSSSIFCSPSPHPLPLFYHSLSPSLFPISLSSTILSPSLPLSSLPLFLLSSSSNLFNYIFSYPNFLFPSFLLISSTSFFPSLSPLSLHPSFLSLQFPLFPCSLSLLSLSHPS